MYRIGVTILIISGLLFGASCSEPIHLGPEIDLLSEEEILAKANFTTINQEIIIPKCLDCHSGPAPEGGIDMYNYDRLLNQNIITPLDAKNSLLYSVVTRKSMPQDADPLDSNELEMIKVWINRGALNDGPIANIPPTVSAGNDIVLTVPTSTATLNGLASDSDGSITSYVWRLVSGPADAILNNTNSDTLNISNLVEGRYLFTLDVTDNDGGNSFDSIIVLVNPLPNIPPTVNAGSDVTITLPVSTYSVGDASATDIDGTIGSYQWSQQSGPGSAFLTNATALNLSISNLLAGSYVFQLTVTDSSGDTATDSLAVNVSNAANITPTANAGADISATSLQTLLTIPGNGSDADGTVATYLWSQSNGTTVNLDTGHSYTEQNLALANVAEGTYAFDLIVTDNLGATSTADTVSLFINSASNPLPTVDTGGDLTIQLPTNSISLSGSAADTMGGNISSYTWTQLAGGPAPLALGGQVTASGLNSPLISTQLDLTNITVAGVYALQLLATDDGGSTITDTMSLTVSLATNVLPTAVPGSDFSTYLANATINGSGTDPDGTITGYQWTLSSGPNTPNLSSATANILSVSSMIDGSYIFDLTVTDDRGGTNTQSITITKLAPIATYSDVSDILFSRCIECHAPGQTASNKGNFTTYDGVILKVETSNFADPTQSILYSNVLDNSMPKTTPPGSNTLTQTQKNTIRDWILSGAPNN